MSEIALIIRHRTLPGRRDEVRAIWEMRMAPAIAGNLGHAAYVYAFDDSDPDVICAFQQYTDPDAANDFLTTDSYRAYLRDVEPLLSGPPQVTRLTPVWSKPAVTR